MSIGLGHRVSKYLLEHYVSVYPCRLGRFSHFQLFVTLWTKDPQAPLSMGFSRQEYWSGWVAMPFSGPLLDPGIKPASLTSPSLAGEFFTTSTPWEGCFWMRLISVLVLSKADCPL